MCLACFKQYDCFYRFTCSKKARENVLEAILLNHPLDCPICDQGGECDLQDQTKLFGGDYSRFYVNKRVVEDKPYGSFIKTVMTRCIHCTRCVRFSDEIAGTSSFGTLNRGQTTEIGAYTSEFFDSEVSGNVIDLCPVGALTSKAYAFKARPWELRSQETVDCTDSVGSRILVNLKESEVVRIQPKVDLKLQTSLITDKIRFSFDSLKKNRIQQVFIKSQQKFEKSNWSSFIEIFKKVIKSRKKVTFLVNDNLELSTAAELSILSGSNKIELANVDKKISNRGVYSSLDYNISSGFLTTCALGTCFLIATNLKTEATLLNTQLRIKFNKQLLNVISLGLTNKTNYPVTFVNLSVSKILSLFEGKLKISSLLLKHSKKLVIIGNSIKTRITLLNNVATLIKKVCPSTLVFYNELRPNSNGMNLMNIKALTKEVVNRTDIFFCVNLEDNIFSRQILKDKKFFWYNTHGSEQAAKSEIILPGVTFLENSGIYINSFGTSQKTQHVLKGLKDTKDLLTVLTVLFKSTNLKNSVLSFVKEQAFNLDLQHTTYFFSSFRRSKSVCNTFVFKFPIKSCIEDFYLDSVFTKNSVLLSQKSQEHRKLSTSFKD